MPCRLCPSQPDQTRHLHARHAATSPPAQAGPAAAPWQRWWRPVLLGLGLAGSLGCQVSAQAAQAAAQRAAPLSAVRAAPSAAEVNLLFNWAEQAFPQFFPGAPASQTWAPYTYRHYPESGNLLGVSGSGVWILGPVAGSSTAPAYVGELASFACGFRPAECADKIQLDWVSRPTAPVVPGLVADPDPASIQDAGLNSSVLLRLSRNGQPVANEEVAWASSDPSSSIQHVTTRSDAQGLVRAWYPTSAGKTLHPVAVNVPTTSWCQPFDHEGSGLQCFAPLAWAPNEEWRWSVTLLPGAPPNYQRVRVVASNAARAVTQEVATLDLPGVLDMGTVSAFNEHWGGNPAPSCLQVDLRAMRITAMGFWNGSSWVRPERGVGMGGQYSETTTRCQNYGFRAQASGLTVSSGGTGLWVNLADALVYDPATQRSIFNSTDQLLSQWQPLDISTLRAPGQE